MVGIGPGNPGGRTLDAISALEQSDVVAGYDLYLDHVADLIQDKPRIKTGMRKETERCRKALCAAMEGKRVSLVSSGDAGVYGMAGLAIEMAEGMNLDVDIEIIPGMTAANAAAALLGAPLMLDFACVSLSDLLVPWEGILKRMQGVAMADLVVALYNPKSRKRTTGIVEVSDILKEHRSLKTPVGICTAVGAPDQRVEISDLGHFLDCEITMRSIVVVGNSTTRIINGKMVNPRGYTV